MISVLIIVISQRFCWVSQASAVSLALHEFIELLCVVGWFLGVINFSNVFWMFSVHLAILRDDWLLLCVAYFVLFINELVEYLSVCTVKLLKINASFWLDFAWGFVSIADLSEQDHSICRLFLFFKYNTNSRMINYL